MKKLSAILLAGVMVFSMAACGPKDNSESSADNSSNVEDSSPESSLPESTSQPESGAPSSDQADSGAESSGGNTSEATGALAILDTIWGSYGDDEKFSAAGGDFSEENNVMDGPGKYSVEDAASLDQMLGLPEASAGKIDDAASLMHMMNANTFTCGAFHVSSADDLTAVADAIRDNIQQRQWMCGFPDKLIVITVDDYVISAFGNEEIIDTFRDKTTAAYSSAVLVHEEPIG